MVKTTGSTGKVVSITIQGPLEVIKFLAMKNKLIATQAEKGLIDAGVFVSNEVQESIMGNRAEPKSVLTGAFANSIVVRPIGKFLEKLGGVKVFPKDIPYADFLELGTSRMGARRHFTHTKERTKGKVRDILNSKIRKI